ncbi:MAG: rod shape-determining protein MreC [Fimbriimonadaceae bacterium]|nr:MAG: rod shape-determining protein MreC [Fimbriimonadaceae bacterium]
MALLACALVLGRIQDAHRAKGQSDPVTAAWRQFTAPILGSFDNWAGGLVDQAVALWTSGPVLAENRALKARLAALEAYGTTVEQLNDRIDNLVKTLGLEPVGSVRVPAQIVAYFPNDGRITLKTKPGAVRPGLPFVTHHGVLAIVQTVDGGLVQALLLTSPSQQVGAKTVSATPLVGLIRGQTPTRLVIDVLEGDLARAGDPVVTSGLGESIPPGLLVGTVVEVAEDPVLGTRRVYVAPAARIDQIREGWILK